jgi:hypothetical protein
MVRGVAVLVVPLALAGCSRGGGSKPAAEPLGDIGWGTGLRIAERASFPVRVPPERYRLLTASETGDSVSFMLLTPRGHLVSLEQAADRSAGLERSLAGGATALGSERITAGVTWRLFRAPALGGLLLLWTDPHGPVVALHGDTSRAELRDLATSLVPRLGPPGRVGA